MFDICMQNNIKTSQKSYVGRISQVAEQIFMKFDMYVNIWKTLMAKWLEWAS